MVINPENTAVVLRFIRHIYDVTGEWENIRLEVVNIRIKTVFKEPGIFFLVLK